MLYIDITDLFEYAAHNSTLSGIQRMSVMVINKYINEHGSEAVGLLVYSVRHGEVRVFGSELFAGDYIYNQAQFCEYFSVKCGGFGGYDELGSVMRSRYQSKSKRFFHYHRIRILNKITRGKRFKRMGISPEPSGGISGVRAKWHSGDVVASGDVIYIPGATWNMDKYIDYLSSKKEEGVRLVQFVHDLVPLVTPEHVVEGVSIQFSQWLSRMSGIVDCYVANSEATRRDLLQFLHKFNKPVRECYVVRLAHEFVGGGGGSNNILYLRDDIVGKASLRSSVLNEARMKYVLCVGTIESRKNVYALARLWPELCGRLGVSAPRLIFAGKYGWLRGDFDSFMDGTGGCGGMIRVVERPTDDELEFLYKNCLFSAYVSYYEGWGLPIGESLWFGKSVVCSSSSSMPEVGGDLVGYVDPNSPDSMLNELIRMTEDDDYRRDLEARISVAKLRTWSDVASDVGRVIDGISV